VKKGEEITDKQYILSVILVTVAAILTLIMAIIIATDNQTTRMNINRYSNNMGGMMIKC
jgi:hypothetical protein